MREWLLLSKRKGRGPMSSRDVLSIRITSSTQVYLRITMPRGLCQSGCPGAIMGHACTGCCARIAGCRWFRNQQKEEEQAKEVQRATCAGERWAIGLSFD